MKRNQELVISPWDKKLIVAKLKKCLRLAGSIKAGLAEVKEELNYVEAP